MNDLERYRLLQMVEAREAALWSDYAYADQAVSDPNFYARREEIRQMREKLKENA